MTAIIPQPRDAIIACNNSSVRLAWNRNFGRSKTENITGAQKFVDSECIRLMVRYTPASPNNKLYKSPTLGTKIGSGRIYYQSPYARYQYYGFLMVSSVTGSAWARRGESKILTNIKLNYSTFRHEQAQARWFEVMKTNHKAQILRGAIIYANGGRR